MVWERGSIERSRPRMSSDAHACRISRISVKLWSCKVVMSVHPTKRNGIFGLMLQLRRMDTMHNSNSRNSTRQASMHSTKTARARRAGCRPRATLGYSASVASPVLRGSSSWWETTQLPSAVLPPETANRLLRLQPKTPLFLLSDRLREASAMSPLREPRARARRAYTRKGKLPAAAAESSTRPARKRTFCRTGWR